MRNTRRIANAAVIAAGMLVIALPALAGSDEAERGVAMTLTRMSAAVQSASIDFSDAPLEAREPVWIDRYDPIRSVTIYPFATRPTAAW